MIESENLCLLLVGKALFIQGFWGASEDVPVTRDMIVTRDATAEREKKCLYIRDMSVQKGCFGHTSNCLERLQFIPNNLHPSAQPMTSMPPLTKHQMQRSSSPPRFPCTDEPAIGALAAPSIHWRLHVREKDPCQLW
jgi:hypothetical protein